VATLSGPDKRAGESAANGLRLAVEDINKDLDQGLGRPLKVVHSDAHGKLEAFEAEAVRLVAVNRVNFLFGGLTPDEVERLDRARVPVITPIGARTRAMGDTVYFTGIAPVQQGNVLAQFAALELGLRDVALLVVGQREDFVQIGETFRKEFTQAAAKKDPGAPAVDPRLRQARDAKQAELQRYLTEGSFKAVVFIGRPEDLRELGALTVPVLFGGEDGSGKALAGLRADKQEIYHVTAFVTDADVPHAVEFARRYQQAFKDEADVHAALAFEGLKLLFEALRQSKDSLTLVRIREELTKLKDVAGVTGALTLLADRQVRRPAFVVRIDHTGAKTVKRYPPE
jgi:ABC-type branched-subunit amino acid transport system substrate-binding protein